MSDLPSNGNTKHRITQYLGDKAMVHFGKLDGLTFVLSADNKSEDNIPCENFNNHEEADTMLVWHAMKASEREDYNDSDIIVAANNTEMS